MLEAPPSRREAEAMTYDTTKCPITVIGLIELLKTMPPNAEVIAAWEGVYAPLKACDFEMKNGTLMVDAESGYLESRPWGTRCKNLGCNNQAASDGFCSAECYQAYEGAM